MSEIVPKESWKASHPVGPDTYFTEIYRLLCHVLASKAIAEHHTARGPLFGIPFQQAEISRLLIHVATYYRIKFDDGSWEHAKWLHEDFKGVGRLTKDLSEPTTSVDLDFREACNKIIHAKRVHFDGTDGPTGHTSFLNPIVHLYGEKQGKEWKAELDLIQFCQAASNVIV